MTLNSDEIYDRDYGYSYSNGTRDGFIGTLVSDDDSYNDIIYGGFPLWWLVDGVESVRFTYEVSVPIPKYILNSIS